jgi:transposase-like protein
MGKRRKVHTAAFQAKVAMAALRERETVSQLASAHGLHPTPIPQWQKPLLEEAEVVFGRGPDGMPWRDAEERATAELYEQIGRWKTELEWLKKSPLTEIEGWIWARDDSPDRRWGLPIENSTDTSRSACRSGPRQR